MSLSSDLLALREHFDAQDATVEAHTRVRVLECQLERAEARIAALKRFVDRYAEHDESCQADLGRGCTCGYDAAYREGK